MGWEELTDGALVAGQPIGAPTWFPCNDRPDARARMRMEITVDDGYTVAATGAAGATRAARAGDDDLRLRRSHGDLPRGGARRPYRTRPLVGSGDGVVPP